MEFDIAALAASKFSDLGINLELASAYSGMSVSVVRQILQGIQVNSQKALALRRLSLDLERLQSKVAPVPVNFRRVAEVKNLLSLIGDDRLKVTVDSDV